jgi:hypothetical protein
VIAGGAALGAVIGLGLGFRLDVLVMAPVGVASVLLFRGPSPWHGLPQKAVAVAALLMALTVTAWPVVSRLSNDGSNGFHVVLLGYAERFDATLGVEPAPYGLMPFYSDGYLTNVVRVRSLASGGPDVSMPSPAYDAVSQGLWFRWLRDFPADAHTRLVAAVNQVLNLPFANVPGVGGVGTNPWLAGVFRGVDGFRGFGWLIGAALILAAAKRAPRLAVFAAMLLLAVTGYPSLQFDVRHAFHLQALVIGAIVVLIWSSGEQLVRVATQRSWRAWVPSPGAWRRPALVAAAVIASIVLLPATVLRAYQAQHLRAAFGEIVEADRTAMSVQFDPIGNDRWLARWDMAAPGAGPADGFGYYVAEFTAEAPRSVMAIGLRYSTPPAWTPCSLVRTLTTAAGVARFAIPVYTTDAGVRFDGLELGSSMRRRLIGVYRVDRPWTDLAVELRLAADWQRRRLYQRLISEERLSADDTSAAISPRQECGRAIGAVDATLDERLRPDSQQVQLIAAAARFHEGAIRFDGDPNAFAPLVQLPPQALAAGDTLVARLWLDRGGVTVGLQKDGAYYRWDVATRPGASVIVIPAPEAGIYTPLISSGDPGWRRALSFTIDRLGIVPADAGNAALAAR